MNIVQQRDDGRTAAAPTGDNMNAVQAGNSCCEPAMTGGGGLAGFVPVWLRGSRGIILLAVAVIGAGMAFGWPALVALGVAPILLSVLPCLVMCAFGLCMMGKGGQPNSTQTSTPPTTTIDRPGV